MFRDCILILTSPQRHYGAHYWLRTPWASYRNDDVQNMGLYYNGTGPTIQF